VNVILTGFMGTGKSTVGRRVAAQLGLTFVDTDAVIEGHHGPIPQIFAERGEDAFRAMEREAASELGSVDGQVIATGGRLMLDPAARAALEANGRVFCLAADVDELVRRLLSSSTERPLLAGDNPAEIITALLHERAQAYGVFEQVETTHRHPADIATDIVGRLRDPRSA
jgi:shikimate kinase